MDVEHQCDQLKVAGVFLFSAAKEILKIKPQFLLQFSHKMLNIGPGEQKQLSINIPKPL